MKKIFYLNQLLIGLGIAVALSACSGDDSSAPSPQSGPSPQADPFVFATAVPDLFVRVDRTGQPAVATALLSRSTTMFAPTVNPGNLFNSFNDQRDAFNRGEPVNDARDFAELLTTGPQPNSLRKIHFEIRPQLVFLGLTPCSTETVMPPLTDADVDISTCVDQVAPVVLPDVITFDFSAPAGWPNGRGFDDPVVDRLLAAALLQLGQPPLHGINTLVGVINPTGDETGTPLPTGFPHLRPAHSFFP